MRCPVCGQRGLFDSFFTIKTACPTCGLTFEREDGYWLGAMIVDMALVLVTFGVVFVGGMLLTWPDVPWTGLLYGTLALNLIVPIVGYPWSMTTWMGMHHAFVTGDRRETERPR
jgi:uncharacterized protein (DUF983 family)